MKSIGKILSDAREERRLSIEHAARNTHIAKQYIQALEEEDYDIFPAKSYVMGFLRRYSLFLDLDANEIISIYNNTIVQEQQIPEHLLKKKTINPKGIAIAILSLVLLSTIVLAIVLLLTTPAQEVVVPEPELRLISFTSDILEREFTAYTSIEYSIDNTIHRLSIREVEDPLTLYNNNTPIVLNIDDVEFIDSNEDNLPDLRIVYRARLSNGNPVLRLDRAVAGSFEDGQGSSAGPVILGATNEASRERAVVPITTLSLVQPFTVRAEFRGPVNFRTLSDNGERVETFYNNGEVFQVDVNNYMYFWISNAGKLDFSVNGENIRLGNDGSTTAFRIALRERIVELTPLY